jgi:hypothetical protein
MFTGTADLTLPSTVTGSWPRPRWFDVSMWPMRISAFCTVLERRERLAELRRQFVDGPVLVIPVGGSAGSDSRGAVVIPGSGTVFFGAYKASGPWGTLDAERGVLVAGDGSRRVSAPVRRDDGTFAGDGWTLKATPGWVVREGARRGDYEVVRQQP